MIRHANAIALLRNARTRFYRGLNQLRDGGPGIAQAAFIVGCGRSGTSMLLARLARSWQVDAYNEDHPDVFADFRLKDFRAIATVIENSHAPLAVFKPILDTHQTVMLLREFPDSKALFVFRHFNDVVNSSLKRFGHENRLGHLRAWMSDDFSEFRSAPPPEVTKEYITRHWSPDSTAESAAALYWLFYNRLFVDLGLVDHPRVELVQYERLVQHPGAGFMRISDALGVSYRRSMVEGIHSSSIHRDPPPMLQEGLRRECEALFSELVRSLSPA